MELYKIENVDFSINHGIVSEGSINLILKEGELFLSLENIILKDEKRWYDLPIKELENVEVISENPIILRFLSSSLELTVSGKYAERLLALRHFLMPYIHPKRKEKMKDSIKSMIKFWSLGVRNLQAFANLLQLTVDEIRRLIVFAKEKGLISQDGKLTDKAYNMFSSEERELLRNLEAING